MKRSSSTLAAAALLAVMAGMAPVAAPSALGAAAPAAERADKQLPIRAPASTQERAAWMRARATGRRFTPYPRPGHTVKQGQRMAQKRRQRAANRAAHRG